MTRIPSSLRDTHVFYVCRACDVLQDRANAIFMKEQKEGLGLRRRWILLAIDGKALIQKELCTMLGINSNSMVEIIDDLESNGYVTREINVANRRSHLISLTDKGRKINVEWHENVEAIFKEVFTPLTRPEIKTIKALCAKIIENENDVDADKS